MGVKLRKHGTVTATFATAQQVDISHANDSVRVGDGTDLMGPLQNVGGVLCFPVKIQTPSVALDATLTGGTQRTKLTDGVDNVGIETVGAEKALKVAVISTVGGGAAPAFTDDAAFTVGTTQCTPCGALADETSPDSVDEGDVGVLRMTLDRLLKIQLAGVASGVAVPITDNAGSITVDGTFWQATQPISHANLDAALSTLATAAKQDTQTTALQLIDDPVATVGAAHVAKAFQVAGSDGTNNLRLKVDANGELQVDVLSSALPTGAATEASLAAVKTAVEIIDNAIAGTEMQVDVVAALPAGTNNIGDVDVLTMPAVAGAVAHDVAVSGNPVRVAGRAMLANGTAVAEDDTTDIATDNQGRVITTPHAPRDLIAQNNIVLAVTTETTLLAAGAAGVFHDLTKLILTNSSSTATRAQIRDATAGTILLEVALAANGGAVIDFGVVPMKQTTAANNWTLGLSGAVTSIYAFIQAVKRIA